MAVLRVSSKVFPFALFFYLLSLGSTVETSGNDGLGIIKEQQKWIDYLETLLISSGLEQVKNVETKLTSKLESLESKYDARFQKLESRLDIAFECKTRYPTTIEQQNSSRNEMTSEFHLTQNEEPVFKVACRGFAEELKTSFRSFEEFLHSSMTKFEEERVTLFEAMSEISSIHSTVNSTWNELADHKRNWNNTMSEISSIHSTVNSTCNELADHRRNWNNTMSEISSIHSTVNSTWNELADHRRNWNNTMSEISSIHSTVNSTWNELADHRRNWNNMNKKKTQCQEGWYFFEDSCYYFSHTVGNWTYGRSQCLAMGGDYVKVSTIGEWNFMDSHITSNSWIGLSDTEEEGIYKWISDGSVEIEINKAWWASGQPDNHQGAEDCIHYSLVSSNKKLWNDNKCETNYRYICEMEPESESA